MDGRFTDFMKRTSFVEKQEKKSVLLGVFYHCFYKKIKERNLDLRRACLANMEKVTVVLENTPSKTFLLLHSL